MSEATGGSAAVSGPEALRDGVSGETVFRENEPLARLTTLGVGGAARWYAEPASIEDLGALFRNARTSGVAVHVLGRGSNVIVPDCGVDGIVIRLRHACWRKVACEADGRLRAGAGVRLRSLCGEACRRGLAGLEFLEGIPGTVGGALRMNAGAMGGWIFDIVEEVRAITGEGELRVFKNEELHYGYRVCREMLDAVAVEATFGAPARGDSEQIRRRLGEYQAKRVESQPRESSAGCIFKNPEGNFAGRIVDELGLKGKRVGDAEVSGVHGNFIINRGSATAADVIGLVRALRKEIRERRGVELEPEVLLLGAEWKEVL